MHVTFVRWSAIVLLCLSPPGPRGSLQIQAEAAQPQPHSMRLCLLFVGLCSSTGWSRFTKISLKDFFFHQLAKPHGFYGGLIDLFMLLR